MTCACDADQSAETDAQRQVLRIALALNATMFVVGIVAGIIGQSSSLIADALDMLADASVSAAAAARARCAAATTEQPRGARSAIEGAGTTPRCCHGSGLIVTAASFVFRYVTELPPAKAGHHRALARVGF